MSKHTGPLSSILGGMYHETFLPTEQDREQMREAIDFLETIPDNAVEQITRLEQLVEHMKTVLKEYDEFAVRMSSAKPMKYPKDTAIPDDWHNRLDFAREKREHIRRKI